MLKIKYQLLELRFKNKGETNKIITKISIFKINSNNKIKNKKSK